MKDFTEAFLKSDEMKGNDERGKYTSTTVFNMLLHNHNVSEEDLVRPQNGIRKTIGKKRIQSKTLVHWKKRSFDDDDDDAMQGVEEGGSSSNADA